MTGLRSGQVARAAEVNQQTLRYYERRGLLAEVAELLDIRARGKKGMAARAAAKLAEVEAKITDLHTIRDALREAVAAGCDDPVTCAETPACPLPFAELGEEVPARR